MTPDPPSDSQLKSQEVTQAATSGVKDAFLGAGSSKDTAKAIPTVMGLTQNQQKRLAGWGSKHQKLVRSVWCGKSSPRTAIKFQCLDCCGEDIEAVRKCADDACPLHAFRPK